MKYDYLIVGAGLFGSVFTQKMIENKRSCIVIDKRNHIGGNIYTENQDNINIHMYGPHIFHTENREIWEYIKRFADFNNFVYRPKVIFKNKVYSFPINLLTLYQMWGVKTPEEAKKKLNQVKIPIENPRNLEEWAISQVGYELYEVFIKGYSQKQWKKDPKELPITIIKRIPIRLNFDDNYYPNNPFQGIPIGGYTKIIEKMLEGADIKLNTNFKNFDLKEINYKKLLYTGRIDEFFDYKHGKLDYRSLLFRHERLNIKDFQGSAGVNYTDINVPYTRIIEHKHFEFLNNLDYTYITYEFPVDWEDNLEPFYPINDERNEMILQKYKQEAEKVNNLLIGGRLGLYKYLDMDQTIELALKMADLELNPI